MENKYTEIFLSNLDRIKELCSQNWIPAQIAREVGMDRHALLDRLRKFNLPVNSMSKSEHDKICSACKLRKPLSDFSKKDKRSGNYSSRCKSCRKLYLHNNMEKTLLSRAKHNAKIKGYEINIDIDDISIPECCPILKVKLDPNSIRYSPSIDRIDSSKGYVKGNIQIISTKANNMKNDATTEELHKFAEYYINSMTYV